MNSEFDNTDLSLVYLYDLFIHSSPPTISIEYIVIIDTIMFCLQQILKRVGGCNNDKVRFLFYDANPAQKNYNYSQWNNVTIMEDVCWILILG